eukprot:scaffold83547_cov53-Phaeocystis_antarctica.AAC.2
MSGVVPWFLLSTSVRGRRRLVAARFSPPDRALLIARRDHAAVVHSPLRARHRTVQARVDAGGACGGGQPGREGRRHSLADG